MGGDESQLRQDLKNVSVADASFLRSSVAESAGGLRTRRTTWTPTRRVRGYVMVAVAALLLSGCSAMPNEISDFCVPALDVKPTIAHAGQTLFVSSDSVCAADVPPGGWVVVAAPVGRLSDGVRVTSPKEVDGSFRLALELPDEFPVGDAFVAIENWDYSSCSDGGGCAGAEASFTVIP